MAQRKTVDILPGAARTTTSLRNIGYTLHAAIADIVDNSVEAGASEVAITFGFEGAKSWIRIADNGSGMDSTTLTEAIRYGSTRTYSGRDLGRFGFGLKTASTSQCRVVTVTSRKADHIEVRQLDLDHINECNRWEAFELEPDHAPRRAIEPVLRQPGTVVLWENLDRVLLYADPSGRWAHERMLAEAAVVDEHLGMVFHRFLSGEIPGRDLAISVNTARVDPWDPFCRDQPETQRFPEDHLQLMTREGAGIVTVRPFVLPEQNGFTSDTAWRQAKGPGKWNDQQGFYIYRAGRMIQSGGWSRMRARDEHIKLARVALEFTPEVDSAFALNIAKATVTLPREIREQLDPIVSRVAGVANAQYRNGARRRKRPPVPPAPPPPLRNPPPPSKPPPSPPPPPHEAPDVDAGNQSDAESRPASRAAFEDVAARIGESAALQRILDTLRSLYPEVIDELGW
jgi:histidine kinase/DNA gyrase B/HSP90-like ATPase